MSTVFEIIEAINENSGLFSLVVSIIAIWISIVAISSQNKIAVFDKRLEIYLKVEKTYTQATKILKVFDKKKTISKSLLAGLILDHGSRLLDLAEKILEKESQSRKAGEDPLDDAEYCDLTIEYYEYCIEFEDSNTPRQVELFFKKTFSSKTNALFDSYAKLKLNFLLANYDDLETMIADVGTAVKAIEESDTLKKMQKTFPI